MSFGVLNIAMLGGLAALALPIVVHLFSRRRYDVVQWGAMQFLELGKRTRRRVRLEDLLLLALRLGMLAFLVIGLARPWGKGGLLGGFSPHQPRDIAVVIDSSYSMGWEGMGVTPHAAAVQWAHELLDRCRPGDKVLLIDAREHPQRMMESPTPDLGDVRRRLDALAPPAGTSRLGRAALEATQALAAATNPNRQIIVLTDGQALPWLPEDDAAWLQLEDLRKRIPVQPRMFYVDVTQGERPERPNVAVDRLALSRELAVPGFPIRITTRLTQSGSEPAERRATLIVNGQPLDDSTRVVTIPAGGEAPVEFEHRFPSVGSYVVSVSVEQDELPGDDRSDAAVVVEQGVRALLVDGDPFPDPVRSETFFLKAAFSPASSRTPWVSAQTIDWRQWGADDLRDVAVVFLCIVPRLTEVQRSALREFVGRGGGLVTAPGDAADEAAYAELFAEGLLPARLQGHRREQEFTLRPVLIDVAGLRDGWLSRLRSESGGDLGDARFGTWWRLLPDEKRGDASPVQVHATLQTLDPLICSRSYGRGAVVLFAVPLSADWSTLPTRVDFVPLVHELVFALLSRTTGRNVEVGMPLQMVLGKGERARDWTFTSPDRKSLPGRPAGDEGGLVELPAAQVAGIYEAHYAADPDRRVHFVAAADRAESDLTPLNAAQAQRLQERGIRPVRDSAEYQAAMMAEAEPVELWQWLLAGVIGLLIAETLVTRRLVRRGQMDVEV